MKIPGFTAEVALYKTSGHYHATGIGSADSSRVVPQLRSKGDSALWCLAVCLCCGSSEHPWCCYRCELCLEQIVTAVSGALEL